MLGQRTEPQKKIYLGVSQGSLIRSIKDGDRETFSYIDGTIEEIYRKERFFNGQPALFWYIDIRDGEELYSLSLPYSSGVFKSIILSLASDKSLNKLTPVRLEFYLGQNGYTKVQVFSEGIKLDWITKQLPTTEERMIGGKVIRDDTKRMEYISSLTDEINRRLKDTE